jgi:uncharacterized RDD family membrane protein YckC
MTSLSELAIETADGEAPRIEGVGFALRALAQGIDLVVHFAAATGAGMIAGILVAVGAVIRGVPHDADLARLTQTGVVSFLAAMLGASAYHVFSEAVHGSTIGKRLCGITVVHEDGGPPTFLGVVKRNLAYYVDSLVFGLVAYQRMSRSPKRQRIGDEWGHTMVVRIGGLEPSARRSWVRFGLAVMAGVAADGLIVFLEMAFRLV